MSLPTLTRPQLFLVIVLFVYLASFFYYQPDFITEDLGRHIKNGQLITNTFSVPTTNLYSFTQPNQPAIMHHWGAGVIYYLLVYNFGFPALTFFSTTIYLATILLAFFYSLRRFGFPSTVLLTLIALPLITSRTMIRPEQFSYLFYMAFLCVLTYTLSHPKTKLTYLLIPLQILWVNTHIFFFIGPGLISLFTLYLRIFKPTHHPQLLPKFITLLTLSILTSLINPFGLDGLLAPFAVTANKQFVTENQNLFVYLKHFQSSVHFYFVFLLTSTILLLLKFRRQLFSHHHFISLTLLLGTALAGIYMIRLSVFFGYTLLAFGGLFVHQLFSTSILKSQRFQNRIYSLTILTIFSGIFLSNHFFAPPKTILGGHISSNAQELSEFLSTHHIQGPILNNFNIGGFLIYHLYPKQQVFIDNRPEAYSAEFIENTYIPLQTNESTWQQLNQKYQFQTIILSLGDSAQEFAPFIATRRLDPSWRVVFQNSSAIVFERLNP